MGDVLRVVAMELLFLTAVFAQQPGESEKPTEPQTAKAASPDSTNVEPIKTVKAMYPEDARAGAIQGQVWVRVLITETGDVEKADIVSGDPILTDSALAAAKKWKFKPFIKNGRPVKVSTKIAFDFAFSDKIKESPVAPASPDIADTTKPIQVSPGVVKGMLVHQVVPVYPDKAKHFGIQGSVVLRAVIGKDGQVADLKPVSGPAELIPAAVGAVQQWRYRPYMFNGQPVAVQTTITVNFTLSRRP